MNPIEFWVSMSKVRVTVTYKLRGAYMFHPNNTMLFFQTFLVLVTQLPHLCEKNITKWEVTHSIVLISEAEVVSLIIV